MIPTSTQVDVKTKAQIPAGAQAVVALLIEKEKQVIAASRLSAAQQKAVSRLIDSGAARGKSREIAIDLVGDSKDRPYALVVAGLGSAGKLTGESFRTAGAVLAKSLKHPNRQKITVVVDAVKEHSIEHVAAGLVSGFLLGSFRYREYKGSVSKKKDDVSDKPIELTIVSSAGGQKSVARAVEEAVIVAEAQNYARTIASRPGNDINPPALAKVAGKLADKTRLKCRVLDEKRMEQLGMGGILAVGAGSSPTPPRLIVLEHRGAGKSQKPLLIVGKAVTFDTGGISIKPAEKMGQMIFDKCGGMSVLGAMWAISRLKLPVNVIGILASAENHISGTAFRPGDILTMYNGVTVEVTNTDAEGRLVLGDAIAWGIEQYKPSACVELSTLTGGVRVALGSTMAGLMTTDDKLADDLIAIGAAQGEKMWRLPLGEEQREQMKSEFADLVNSAGREAHPLQGGAFLSYFVPEDGSVPFAHLDIAAVATTEKETPCYARGATGWGVRTLVEWARRHTQK